MEMRGRIVVSALLAVLLAGPAWAQSQSKEQQGCINFLNKSFAKVALTQAKVISNCIDDYAKGKGVTNVQDCAHNSEAVPAAQTKALEGSLDKCPIEPTLGPTTAGYTNYVGEVAAESLFADLLGPLDFSFAKCADAPVECKCQSTMVKTTSKLFAFYLKGFNKCKKNGLKAEGAEQIVDDAGLVACIADSTKFDPKGKHAKLVEKAKSAIAKGCSALVTNPLPRSYECQEKTGDDLALCIDQRIRCHTCAKINDVDGLNLYESCDTFDDGVVNSSCYGA